MTTVSHSRSKSRIFSYWSCCYYWLAASTTTTTRVASAWSPSRFSVSNNSAAATAFQQKRNMATSVAPAAAASNAEVMTTTTDSTQGTSIDSTPSSFFSKLTVANSWIAQLSPESPENYQKSLAREHLLEATNTKNQVKRPVFNGHYVLVDPTPLPNPRLVLTSRHVAVDLLGLSQEAMESEMFVKWVSGNLPPSHEQQPDDSASNIPSSWATPYALSIMGTRYSNNCPYGTGDGYGDGRAISIAEITNSRTDKSYELQLKGAGTTPFCRGADGRAVLRSSIREFLASEAMHYLNVPTTRALSLVVSDTLKVNRPWYTEGVKLNLPAPNDPRLEQYTPEQRQQLMMQLRNQKADPNIMQQEPAAITCRVAPSFVRVGHLDLFARRAERKNVVLGKESGKRWHTDTPEWKELEQMIWHACYREYREQAYEPFIATKDIAGAATVLLTLAADRIAFMVAQWLRVGFAQGNFNADNCLVSGLSLDYGPFGWIESYNPLFAKWTGSGEHFGFMNQPSAGFANYNVLVESIVPVICAARNTEDVDAVVKEFAEPAAEKFQAAVDTVFRTKLGLEADQDIGDDLWESLETMMRKTLTDYTLLFRQLTYLVKEFPDLESNEYERMVTFLVGDDAVREGSSPFYEPLSDDARQNWITWMEQWRTALASLNVLSTDVFERMRTTNPKYILREWMLVDAYNSAARREEAELFSLYSLIQHPYDEGSAFDEAKYYRRAPDEALKAGGTAFMSCSS